VKALYTLTAVTEVVTGSALIWRPSAIMALLLGAPLNTPAAVALGRVAGVALFALGVACQLARPDAQSRAARGLVGRWRCTTPALSPSSALPVCGCVRSASYCGRQLFFTQR